MQYFILAISLICSMISLSVSVFTYMEMHKTKLSVPDKQACEQPSQTVVKKDSPESDSEEKWKNLKDAFNLSGKTNGRSRIS